MSASLKRPVRIRLTSVIEDERIRQSVEGEWYGKGSADYYRYRETDSEQGDTTVLLKVKPNEIRLLRSGGVRSEQVFLLQRTAPGYYELAQGRLRLEAATRTMHIHLDDGEGTVEWSYDLYISGEKSSSCSIMLEIRAL